MTSFYNSLEQAGVYFLILHFIDLELVLCSMLLLLDLNLKPKISFAFNKVSQFMANPLDAQWVTFKGILRYLNAMRDAD